MISAFKAREGGREGRINALVAAMTMSLEILSLGDAFCAAAIEAVLRVDRPHIIRSYLRQTFGPFGSTPGIDIKVVSTNH